MNATSFQLLESFVWSSSPKHGEPWSAVVNAAQIRILFVAGMVPLPRLDAISPSVTASDLNVPRFFQYLCGLVHTGLYGRGSPAREPVGSRHRQLLNEGPNVFPPDSPALSVALFSGTPPFLSEAAIAATHTARAASFRLGMCEVPHTLAWSHRTSTNMLAARWGATS